MTTDTHRVEQQLAYLMQIRGECFLEVRHLQDLRFRLISVYFLILGGTGFLANLILKELGVDVAVVASSPSTWLLAFGVLALHLMLAISFGSRTAQYTDVIRTDLNRAYEIDRYIINNLAIDLCLEQYRKSSFSQEWRKQIRGWPVGMLIFPSLSSLLAGCYAYCFTTFFLRLSFKAELFITFLSWAVILVTTALLCECLPRKDAIPKNSKENIEGAQQSH